MLFYTVGQSRIFLTMLYSGLFAGVYVSIDGALRRLFEAGRMLASVMDLLMGTVLAFIVISGLLIASDGELRLYSLLGALCGFLIYRGSIHPVLEWLLRCAARAMRRAAAGIGRTSLVKKLFK